MVWNDNLENREFESNLMKKLEDNEIIIGNQHPMKYACSIFIILHNIGIAKIYINKKSTFECRITHLIKCPKDRWIEVKKFLDKANVKITDDRESEVYEVITLSW